MCMCVYVIRYAVLPDNILKGIQAGSSLKVLIFRVWGINQSGTPKRTQSLHFSCPDEIHMDTHGRLQHLQNKAVAKQPRAINLVDLILYLLYKDMLPFNYDYKLTLLESLEKEFDLESNP